MAAMLVDRNKKIFLLGELTSIYVQTVCYVFRFVHQHGGDAIHVHQMWKSLHEISKALFRLGTCVRFLGTDTSLNIALYQCTSKTVGTGTNPKGKPLGTVPGHRHWCEQDFVSSHIFFLMPPYHTVNKMAGVKLTKRTQLLLGHQGV